jgi:hypothetical protein
MTLSLDMSAQTRQIVRNKTLKLHMNQKFKSTLFTEAKETGAIKSLDYCRVWYIEWWGGARKRPTTSGGVGRMNKRSGQRRTARSVYMGAAYRRSGLDRGMRCLRMVGLVVIAGCSMVANASAYTQTISAGTNLNAVSCVPGTTDCVISQTNGNAFYATNVSATSEASWSTWTGPTSPNETVACPASTLCLLADGENRETSGGQMYYATSFGGAWNETFKPTIGVFAANCPSSSFCVAAQALGRISYSTSPASTSWTTLKIGSGTMNGVSCLSSSFCAVVNKTGELYVATTEAHIKEVAGWKSANIDSTSALHGVACTSTTSCVAVDGAGNVVNITISSEGTPTASTQDIDGTNELTSVTCATSTCVAVDSQGKMFVSTNGGTSWTEQYVVNGKLTSVSCVSTSLCLAADTAGSVTTFNPAAAPASHTQLIDSGNGVNAVSCIYGLTDCIVSDTKGNAYYATNVSTSATGTWTKWSGPSGQSPSQAVSCPTTSLCVLADGRAEEGGGGKLYYATSLGGTWTEAFDPLYGVVAVSCASTALCVTGQAEGFIRYATIPASEEWSTVELGLVTMSAVECVSSSFCAVVDSKGNVHIANTEAKVKESAGWKSTDVDGTTALHGVSCTSTKSCVAVDNAGNVLNLTIESSGAATVSKSDIDGTGDLTAVSCAGSTCATVDNAGNVFVSNNSGETWIRIHKLEDKLTSISCAATSLCLTADTAGNVTAFDAR